MKIFWMLLTFAITPPLGVTDLLWPFKKKKCARITLRIFRGCLNNNHQGRSLPELIFFIYIFVFNKFLWLQIKCRYWVSWFEILETGYSRSDLHPSMLEGLHHVSLRQQLALFECWVFTFPCFHVFSFLWNEEHISSSNYKCLQTLQSPAALSHKSSTYYSLDSQYLIVFWFPSSGCDEWCRSSAIAKLV